jgi:hypothetical protein
MAFVTLPGDGLYVPFPYPLSAGLSLNSSTIDATGEKFAFVGRFRHEDRASKDISRVGFRFATVTKSGGSGLTVSLQTVNTAAGPPYQPDETQDQTVAIANGNASFASNAWLRTDALSANRTTANGELLAVVIEYDGGGRTAPDSVNIAYLTNITLAQHSGGGALKTGGSWAAAGANSVVLECSDGSFGTLENGLFGSAVNSHAYNVDTATTDEHALEFSFPVAVKVDGCWLGYNASVAGADAEVILYDGTTPMTGGTVTVDGNAVLAANGSRSLVVPFSQEIELAANTTYRLGVRPTTTSNVTVFSIDVSDAAHFGAHGGGTAFKYATRLDQGAWAAATATRRLYAGLRVSAVHDGRSARANFKLGV